MNDITLVQIHTLSSSQLYKQSDIYKLGKTVQQIISVEKTVSIREQKLMDGKNNIQMLNFPLTKKLWPQTQLAARWEKK